jgi:methyl-accepting chemotaxis protein
LYEPVRDQNLLRKMRRRIARVALNYPTDPANLAVISLGILILIGTLFGGAPWALVMSGAVMLAAGTAGLVVVRSRYVIHGLPVTLLGATAALFIALITFAAFPLWWVTLVPAAALLSAAVLYYWGTRRAALWYAAEAFILVVGGLIAAGSSADNAIPLQALVAAELLLLVLHVMIVLAVPEQSESMARNTAIAQQSSELGNLSLQISATADGLGRASSAIHMVTGQQSSGAEQQAAVITEAVTMLNEFIALADQVRNQARTVVDLSETTTTIGERGQEAINTTIEGMNQIRAQVTVIAHNIAALAEQLKRIDEIIASVSEIATQSNLLALNASIEAARAGAHGRGFAVVADEVRTLSQQSKEAAAQVQTLLTEIKDAMKQTVRATELGDDQVDQGMGLSREAGETIELLAGNVNQTAEAMRSIMIAIDQQAAGLEQITQSMRNIHDVTQKNLESTRTAEIVAENLNRLSEELLVAIARYSGDSPVEY